jgi:hypothetical protein
MGVRASHAPWEHPVDRRQQRPRAGALNGTETSTSETMNAHHQQMPTSSNRPYVRPEMQPPAPQTRRRERRRRGDDTLISRPIPMLTYVECGEEAVGHHHRPSQGVSAATRCVNGTRGFTVNLVLSETVLIMHKCWNMHPFSMKPKHGEEYVRAVSNVLPPPMSDMRPRVLVPICISSYPTIL